MVHPTWWWFWPAANIAFRVFGIAMLGMGLMGFMLSALTWSDRPAGQQVDLLGEVGCFGIGLAIVVLKPFRPDLVAKGWTADDLRSARPSWWTGTPRQR